MISLFIQSLYLLMRVCVLTVPYLDLCLFGLSSITAECIPANLLSINNPPPLSPAAIINSNNVLLCLTEGEQNNKKSLVPSIVLDPALCNPPGLLTPCKKLPVAPYPDNSQNFPNSSSFTWS